MTEDTPPKMASGALLPMELASPDRHANELTRAITTPTVNKTLTSSTKGLNQPRAYRVAN